MSFGAAIVGGSIVSGLLSNDAANTAADASTAATQASIDETSRQFDLTRQDMAPWRVTGANALNALNARLGLPQFNQTPEGEYLKQPIPMTWEEWSAERPGKEAVYKQHPKTGAQVLVSPAEPGGTTQEYNQYVQNFLNENPQNMVPPGYAARVPPGSNFLSQSPSSVGIYDAFEGGQLPPEYTSTDLPPEFIDTVGPPPEYQGTGDFVFNLEDDPGYQFARAEAERAVNRGQAGMGGFNSGNRLAELGDRIAGLASTYANDAFNRQFSTSRENYGRNLTDYNVNADRNRDLYGRNLTQFGLDTDRNREIYNRNLTDFGMNRDRDNTIYNRRLTEHGLDVSRNQDIYGRDQNYLNRLQALSGVGQTSAAQTGQLGANVASDIGNYLMTNAANQGNAANIRNQGLNNAVQGGISNYLTYDYLNRNPRLN